MTFIEWLEQQNNTVNKGSGLPPEMDAQMAIEWLRIYLLGPDWYRLNPALTKRCNTEIVAFILYQYSEQYRKELEEFNKK